MSFLSKFNWFTLYYYRTYATNSQGMTYGNEVAVATLRLVDGESGDSDGEVNGSIYDPGEPPFQ